MLMLFLNEQNKAPSSGFGVLLQFGSNQWFFFLQGFKLRLSVLERVGVFMYIQNIPLTDYAIRTLRVSIVTIFVRS